MRAVVQRVRRAAISVDGRVRGEIGRGLVVLLGVGEEDGEEDARYLADKIVNLRIFEDEAGKMNLSLLDVRGELMAVSQFTLYGDCRQGRRPGFSRAARPERAEGLYLRFVELAREYGLRVKTGQFRAAMLVEIHNDGPVTLLLDSEKQF